jgi:hypothetical protein
VTPRCMPERLSDRAAPRLSGFVEASHALAPSQHLGGMHAWPMVRNLGQNIRRISIVISPLDGFRIGRSTDMHKNNGRAYRQENPATVGTHPVMARWSIFSAPQPR